MAFHAVQADLYANGTAALLRGKRGGLGWRRVEVERRPTVRAHHAHLFSLNEQHIGDIGSSFDDATQDGLIAGAELAWHRPDANREVVAAVKCLVARSPVD